MTEAELYDAMIEAGEEAEKKDRDHRAADDLVMAQKDGMVEDVDELLPTLTELHDQVRAHETRLKHVAFMDDITVEREKRRSRDATRAWRAYHKARDAWVDVRIERQEKQFDEMVELLGDINQALRERQT